MRKYSAAIRIILAWKYFKLKVFFIYSYWSYVLPKYFNKSRPSKFIHTRREEFKKAYGVLCKNKKALIYDGHSYNLKWKIGKKYSQALGPILSKVANALWMCEKAGINAEFLSENDEFQTLFDVPQKSSSDKVVPFFYPRRFIVQHASFSSIAYKLSEKLPLRKEIRSEADKWFNEHIRGDWVAVHYRSMDIEAGKATKFRRRYKTELESYITYLKVVLDDKCSIFACSNQAQFVDKMQVAFPGRVFARDIQRSSSRKSPHKTPEYKGIQQRKDELIDMLILAKADLIYTTGSAFVDTVKYFNPKTKIVSLDERKIGEWHTPIILLWKYFKLKVFFIYSYWSYVLPKYFNKSRPSKFIHTSSKEFKKAYGVLCKNKKALIYDGHSYNLKWKIGKKYSQALSSILSNIANTLWMCEKAGINAEFFSENDEFQTLFDVPQKSSSDKVLPFFYPRGLIVQHAYSSPVAYKLSEKLPLRKELKEKADEWFDKHIRGDWVAVHYRGTDIKVDKATIYEYKYKIELEPYITYLRTVLDDKYSIFVCSDQAQFIDKMQVAFPGRVFARDIQRSSNRKALHLSPEYKGMQQRKDALLDMLILAKADLIYTTGSSFVDAVGYFNPKTKIVSLDGRKIGGCQTPIPRKDVFDKQMHKYPAAIRIILSWKYFKLKVFFVYDYWSHVLPKYFNQSRPSKFIHNHSKEFKKAYGVLRKNKKALIYDGHSYDLKWRIGKKYSQALSPILSNIANAIWICEKVGINAKFFTQNDEFQTLFDIPKQSSSDKVLPFFYSRGLIVQHAYSSLVAYKLSEKLSLRKELKEEIDEWFDKHIRGDWVAVHYRGTDVEAGKTTKCKKRYKIELESYITYLKVVLDDKCSIFACSDQSQFIDKMQAVFPSRVFARDIQRSSNRKALHLSPEYKGIQQRKDALIDMLILAKADLIYTTGSSFVDTVRCFNPETKIVSFGSHRKRCYIPIPRKEVFDKLKIQ